LEGVSTDPLGSCTELSLNVIPDDHAPELQDQIDQIDLLVHGGNPHATGFYGCPLKNQLRQYVFYRIVSRSYFEQAKG
jgi:hypothetical protein